MKSILLTFLMLISLPTFAEYRQNYNRKFHNYDYDPVTFYKESTCKDLHRDVIEKLKNKTLNLRNGHKISFLTRDSFECLEAIITIDKGSSQFIDAHFVQLGTWSSVSSPDNYLVFDFQDLSPLFDNDWIIVFLSLNEINNLARGVQIDVEFKTRNHWDYSSGRLE